MDVTGNNIANVNTVGFKGSQTVFQDTLSQVIRAAGRRPPTAVARTRPRSGSGSRSPPSRPTGPRARPSPPAARRTS
ncbi:flagellar basal body protein [Blastococcus sp. PRF04-17]|uniref:flagellar basal body protein n=1 Tax=Blastococcus sp. PRF04-17 TaxID=2933797 RepID=UPI001FF17927|nr:flagellar basal body protein [Blastococcus sp. PRF04-17]UOY04012.1 flagellar basal body protein [Blastococcus sp. PRF04-17]